VIIVKKHLMAAAGLALLLAAGMACEDDQTSDEGSAAPPPSSEPQAQLGRAAPEQQNLKAVKVEIRDREINPRQLELQAAQPVQLEIRNSTASPCTFYIEGYVVGVQVPPGETARQSLTLPQGTNRANEVDMGCQGDDQRQGTAVIEFRGTAPGEGR
jgi:hypothetical protein